MTPGPLPETHVEGEAVDEEVFAGVLAETVEVLDADGVDYLLMGGVASATFGRPRWTHDVDVFVRPEDAHRTLHALASAGFDTEETFPDWLFKAFRAEVLVDIIFKSTGGIYVDDEMLARARNEEIRGLRLRLIPPEDLVVIKAVVHDEHMPRHWHDAVALVAGCELDWDYLVERARRHGARRILSLLLYAQSNDIVVPNAPIRALYEAIFRE